MTKQSVLIFGHSYATQFIDISNQYTQLFDPKKFTVTVAYLTGAADESIRQRHLAEKVIFLDATPAETRGLKISVSKKMLELQRNNSFNIVICHRYKPTYIMLWIAQFIKIPVIFSVMHELGTLKNISRRVLIAALAKTNVIFAGVSDAVRDDMRKTIWKIPKERVITLHNMIDVDFTEPELLSRAEARAKFNLAENTFVFGTIGRLAKNKDQQTLIHSFAAVKAKHPNSKLIIIGDGALETELKALARSLHIENDVIFTGFLPHGFRYLKAFDVYISSSIQEAFGRVLLEAMIARLPIIATRVNGVPEVIGDSGILIPAADTEIMTKEMLRLYASTEIERNQLGQRGYERALTHFSLKRFREIFWDLPIIKEIHA